MACTSLPGKRSVRKNVPPSITPQIYLRASVIAELSPRLVPQPDIAIQQRFRVKSPLGKEKPRGLLLWPGCAPCTQPWEGQPGLPS